MKIKLYNTLTRQKEDFKEIKKGKVGLYSCGPTVYDYAHIGNLRAFLCADLLQRVLKVIGDYDIKWVMNITDIDDKTIKKINDDSAWVAEMQDKSGDLKKDLKHLTSYYRNKFIEDIKLLGINYSDFYSLPNATDYIEEMKELIIAIYNNGFAYLSNGAIYFNVEKWRQTDKYGKLKNLDFENMRSSKRIDSDEYEKEQVADFVLWKSRKENEPYWELNIDGNVLEGRPGWHLECSTMEKSILGLPFDIHTGGIDLQFPHHEDEIAQSKAGYGIEPTNYWFHNEFLQVEGNKMSKSAGNFYTLRDLLNKGLDPLDIRFAMFSSHYRSKYNFTFADVEAARKSRNRIQNFILELLESDNGNRTVLVEGVRSNVFSHLADDLHTPKAMASLFDFINDVEPKELDKNSKDTLIEFFKELNEIFDIWTFEKRNKLIIPEEVVNLAEKRMKAKANKNFELADMIRNELEQRGFIVKDTKDSYTLEKK